MIEEAGARHPLSPAQEALWLAWRLDPSDPTYHVALAYRLEGAVDAERLEAAWRAVVARHVTLHGAYRQEDAEVARVPAAGGGVRFERGPVPEEGLGAWAARPFELETGPVTRVGLFSEGPGRFVLAGALHHVACDGLSAAVLLGELAALDAGRPVPPVQTSYDEHVRRARQERVPAQALEGPAPRLGAATHVVRRLDAGLLARLRRAARALGVTPAAVFQTVFRAWLWRHTGAHTVAVPFAGRTRGEWRTVGYFSEAKLVPLAAGVLEDGTLRSAVEAVGDATSRARRSGTPARRFDGMFNVLPPIPGLALEGVRAEPLRVPLVPRLAGVGLTVHEQGDALELEWSCAREGWRESLPAWAEGFEELAEAACAEPDRPLRGLPILGEARRRANERGLDGGLPLPGDVLARFWSSVDQQPDAIAIDGVEAWTRARLAGEVRALASRLEGLPPGAIVSLELARSPWAVAAVLAVLERRLAYAFTGAGAAEVPGCAAIIRLSPGEAHPLEVLRLNAASPECPDAAVVVSTSGSTGAPKAIILARPAVESYAEHARRLFGLESSDRVLQFHALTFDGHVEELLPAVSAGAALVLSDGVLGARELFERLEREAVTVLSLPTAYWALAATQAKALGLRAPKALRLCVVGGEAVTPSALEAWRAVAPGLRFLNTYGPAEATVAVTTSGDETLGRPNPGASLSVRDASGQRVPEGVVGELWIDGPCVAPGITRPHRSGDLVRLLADGRLEFHGRLDRQLKVLGQRVEPLAVEAALVAAGARRAVVAVRDGLLTACVEGPLDLARLREALRRLTPASRPVRFAFVEALPLTPHGKIDAAALEAIAAAPLSSGTGRAPAPGREARIAAVFAEVLKLGRVHADDDFFELGGDSLRGLECTVRLSEVLGDPVSLASLYAHPTPERLAQAGFDDDERWRTDVALPVRVPASRRAAAAPQRLLLTGATGLVGAHLLEAWLAVPGTHVTCLVRAPNEEAARHRLGDVMGRYGLTLDRARVAVWAGELSTLPASAAELDAVVHAAGCTDLRRTYAELRPANVEGVVRVLELGLPVHLVSSLSAIEGPAGSPPAGAYPRSKWVAERLAETARAAGASVWTYRMGRVWGSERVGVTPESDALWAAARRGLVPLEEAAATVIPADRLARELVRLAREAPAGTYAIDRPMAVDLAAYRRRLQE